MSISTTIEKVAQVEADKLAHKKLVDFRDRLQSACRSFDGNNYSWGFSPVVETVVKAFLHGDIMTAKSLVSEAEKERLVTMAAKNLFSSLDSDS